MKFLNEKTYNQIILLISVFFVPVTFLFFFQDAFFDTVGWLDPFLYVGYGLNYTDPSYLSWYYKISRLPWVLVQFIFRGLLNENLASYVLHFTIYSGASYLIFQIAKKNFGIIPAFVVAMLTPSLLFIYSGGPDYHNSFSAVLFLALILYVINGTSKAKDDNKFFVITGVIYALIVHTNLLLSFDAFVYASCFYVALKIKQSKPIFDSVVKKIFLVIGGMLACTLVLCLINYSFGRHFLFMRPLLDFMVYHTKVDYKDWRSLDKFIKNATYLSSFFAMFLFSSFLTTYLYIKKIHLKTPLVFFGNLAFILVSLEILLTHNIEIGNLHVPYIAFTCLTPFIITLATNLGFIFNSSPLYTKKSKILIIILISMILLVAWQFNQNTILIHHFFIDDNNFLDLTILWILLLFGLFFLKNCITKSAILTISFAAVIFFLQIKSSDIKSPSYQAHTNCGIAKSMTKFYTEFDNHVKKYKQDFTVNGNGNIFVWWNKNQNINYSSCLTKIDALTSAVRSIVCAGGPGYQLDNAWEQGGMSDIDKLWPVTNIDGKNDFKTNFLNYTKYPRVLALITYDENDVQKMIKKMKSYGINFTLSEKRKVMADAFILEYYILVEN